MLDTPSMDGYWLGLALNQQANICLTHLEGIYAALSLVNSVDRSWTAVELRNIKLIIGIEIKLMRRILQWSENIIKFEQEDISQGEMEAVQNLIKDISSKHAESLNRYRGVPEIVTSEMKIPDVVQHFNVVVDEIENMRSVEYRYIQSRVSTMEEEEVL